MSRLIFDSPLLLGFDHLEQMMDRLNKSSGSGYPPYNIEQLKIDVEYGNLIAGKCIQKLGARNGILTEEELMTIVEKK